jgi:hypothetical protein
MSSRVSKLVLQSELSVDVLKVSPEAHRSRFRNKNTRLVIICCQ